MRPKTDPKTQKTIAIFTSRDVAAVCAAVDVIRGVAVIEDDAASRDLSTAIKTWLAARPTPTNARTVEASDG